MSKIEIPDEEWQVIQSYISQHITKNGLAILFIGPEGLHHGFGYTVGNHLKGLPELLLIGPTQETDYILLNKLSSHMLAKKRPFKDGELLKPGKRLRGVVWDANQKAKDEYTWQAGEYYEHDDYRVQQVVLADQKGLLPNNPKCDLAYRVPILRSLVLS